MNTTTNLNLKKPEYSDDADIGDINDNMDTLDGMIGALPSGSTIQGQINTIDGKIGSTALPTTAQTLTGAIAEHETDLGTKLNKNQGSDNSGKFMKVGSDGVLVPANVPETPIDDTKGLGDTDFVWSADKDVKELLKVDGAKANNESVYSVHTASGSIVEIEDGAAEAVKQMRIEIAPVQDLHGYDHPWVGGATRNIWSSGDVSKDNSAVYYAITGLNIPAGTYSFSGVFTSANTPTNMIRVSFRQTQNAPLLELTANDGQRHGGTFTLTETCTSIYFYGTSNASEKYAATYKDLQLEVGSTVTDYVPYANICPISGWTGAKVFDVVSDSFYDTEGTTRRVTTGTTLTLNSKDSLTITASSKNYCSTKQLLSSYNLVEGKKYTLTATLSNASGNYASYMTIRSSADTIQEYVQFNNIGETKSFEFTYDSTIHNYISFFSTLETVATASCTYSDIKFAESNGISITFPSASGTVYGGNLTVNADGTGTLVVDWKNLVFSSMSDFTGVNSSGQSQTTGNYWASPYISLSDAEKAYATTPGNGDGYGKFDKGRWINSAQGSELRAYAPTDRDRIYVVIQSKTYDLTTSNGRDAYMTEIGSLQVAYKLATPVTYTLTTDQVLHLLNGHNTVWADCGDISFDYYAEKYLTSEQADKERIHESITTSAPVQTFHDGADNVPMGLKVAVDSVQNLHGYEYPWVGGARNNLAKGRTIEALKADFTTGTWSGNSYTVSGVTFACEVDSMGIVTKVNTSGTASANAAFVPWIQGLESGATYKLTGCPANGSSSKYEIGIVKGTVQARDYGNGVEYTPSETTTFSLQIIVRSGQNSTGLEFAPLLTISTVTDRTWYPYQNICPISGHDKAEVTRTGKNLFDKINKTEINCYIDTANNKLVSNTSQRCIYIQCKPNTTYTVRKQWNTSENTDRIGIAWTKEVPANNVSIYNGQTVTTATVGSIVSCTTTTGADAKYLVVWAGFSSTLSYNTMQIEVGSSASSYESYTDKQYTIPFSTTMYGGYLTVGKDGEVEVTATHAFVDLGDLSWSYKSSPNMFGSQSLSYKTIGGSRVPNAKAEAFKASSINSFLDNSPNGAFAFGSTGSWNGYLCIRNTAYTDATEFKASVTGSHLYYELATPITVKLNPCSIHSLLGTNNVWADTGDILELNYSADTKLYIDGKFAELQALILENINNV